MGGWVVCPEGLNREHEALQFTFQDLPLLNATAMDEPSWHPPLIEVDLGSIQPNRITTAIQAPNTMPVLPPLWPPLLNLLVTSLCPSTRCSRGAWSSCSRLPTISTLVSHHCMPKRELPSVALGALPSMEVAEDPLGPNEKDPALSFPMASPRQV